jgi:exo-beta-1,3-glucanase (GH17 family)
MKRESLKMIIIGFMLLFFWSAHAVASIVPCLADIDGDGDIDGTDSKTIAEGLPPGSCSGGCPGDLDRDGSVDADDLRRLAEGFGRIGCPEINYRLHGLNFSPYMDGQDPNQGVVVSEDQVRERMQIVAPFTEWVRSFGTAHGLEHIPRVARDFGLNTAVGAWLGDDMDKNARQMQNLIAAAQSGEVDLAIIGSEVLLRGDLSDGDLIAYIEQFKAAAPAVTVTTADVYSILLAHPTVMAACDVILVNYYPYWECLPVDRAMARLHDMHQQVVAAVGGKQVIVSEAGWPSDGEPNCAALPSSENASDIFARFVSWARAEDVGYFYFEAFDEAWKAAYEGEVGAHWGIWDRNGIMKDGMEAPFYDITVPDCWNCQPVPGGPGIPDIQFSYVPPHGGCVCAMEGDPQCHLFGTVAHVNPEDYRVAVYIRVGTSWYNKPYWNQRTRPIDCRGLWRCDIVTDANENDRLANAIRAFLIRADYDPPEIHGWSELPPGLYENAVAHVEAVRSP